MNNKHAATMKKAADAEPTKPDAALRKGEMEIKTRGFKPLFVEAEKMFERFADISKETAGKAFELFERRGGEFGHDFEDWLHAEAEVLVPVTLDVTETGDEIHIRAAVPGFKREDIALSIEGDILMLTGETEVRDKREDENKVFTEWRSNKFCRKLTLPGAVDAEKVVANLKDGLLHLTLPKARPVETTKVPVNLD